MEMENKKLRDVAEIARQIMVGEELKGGQKKLDKNHNNKLDGQDFAILRGQKKANEETEKVEEEIELDETSYTTKRNPDGTVKSGAVDQFTKAGGKVEKGYFKIKGSQSTERNADGSIKKSATAGATYHKEETIAEEETILEYESKDGKFVHRAKPGSYGGTKDEKHAVDTMSGPKTKELKAIESEKKKKFSEDLDLYKDQGIKGLFEAWAKKKAMKEAEEAQAQEEVISEEPTSAEFDAQLADAKQRAAGTKKQAEVSKPAVQAVQNEETHTIVQVVDIDPVNGVQHSEIDLEERHLTEPETKKKEEIVKSMKKGIAGFKDRYGDRAKEVMYATATARAKGE